MKLGDKIMALYAEGHPIMDGKLMAQLEENLYLVHIPEVGFFKVNRHNIFATLSDPENNFNEFVRFLVACDDEELSPSRKMRYLRSAYGLEQRRLKDKGDTTTNKKVQ